MPENSRHDAIFLSSLIERSENEHTGIIIDHLTAGDKLEVRTRNSVYYIEVLDPKTRKIRVYGTGKFFQTPSEEYLHGSTLAPGCSAIRLGWIAVGHSLLIGHVRLSPVQSFLLNNCAVCPDRSKRAS